MFVIPLVEVKGGETVHVLAPPSVGEVRPIVDPVEVVGRFAAWGAQGFHVVDVDHAVDPQRDNDPVLVSILDHTTLPVVAGGGVRSLRRIQELLDTGARRVLVGSMGVLHLDWLKEAALIFSDRLVACIDTDGRQVFVKGRTETTGADLESVLTAVDGFGLAAVHVAYLGTNGGAVPFACEWAPRLQTPFTFQAPIGSPGDLDRLGDAGVKGAVLGPEVYDGRLPFPPLAKQFRVR